MNELKKAPSSVSRVSLGIFGRNLDVGRITSGLGVEASKVLRSAREDEQRDLWSLVSPLGRTDPVSAHLRWLQQTIQPRLSFLKTLKNEAEVRIYCGLNAGSSKCEWSFSSEELKLFVDLGIPLEVTVLF